MSDNPVHCADAICYSVRMPPQGFSLTLITQVFDPSCHRGKADIHSFGGICHCVVLVNNQLSGFSFEFRTKISSFHLRTCIVTEVSILPLFRWPNSVNHYSSGLPL
ncbi:hypothetical protein G2583_pO550041 (plasmid) [Escherichia coli O55:H7 str. CB9615]|nr:hypothetical protein G2583_pO550041 [Escherichia coli O55:H7 str. CB9615]